MVPIFWVSNKNEEVQSVSYFRKLNEDIKRNPWPILDIQDMLHQFGDMTYTTVFDMIILYYAMNLRENMKITLSSYYHGVDMSTIRYQWDWEYHWMFFQKELIILFQNMPYVLLYIDDILVITKESYEQHLQGFKNILWNLKEAEMWLNIDKYCFEI